MARLDFWYEFASTYSYVSAMRVETLAKAAGVELRWRPFLLGPIFVEQGWNNSPFNIYPVKGRYMWRDMERICEKSGLPLVRPQAFPQNSITAARAALALSDADRPAFSRAIYEAEFAKGRLISERVVVAAILSSLGHDAESVLTKAGTDEIKTALKVQTEEAKKLGIFGAPAFVCPSGELFWGNDRLEDALLWAKTRG